MSEARVGVIGAGWWSSLVHLPALQRNPDASIVGICDVDIARAKQLALTFDIPHACASHGDLLDLNLDAVIVCTPHDQHYIPARDSLQAGADVLVEKPMAIDPAEAWDLVATASASGRKLHVGYPLLYNQQATRLRAALRSGDLGKLLLATGVFATAAGAMYALEANEDRLFEGDLMPRRASTYADPQHGGGQTLTQVTHVVSLLLWLTGLHGGSLAAATFDADLTVDMVSTLLMRSSNGTLITVASTGSVRDHAERVEDFRVFGDRGQAQLDTVHGHLNLNGVPQPTLDVAAVYPADAPSRQLVAGVLHGEPVIAPGELGAQTAEVLAAARRGAVTETWITGDRIS